jgi:CRP-like cAMP-binding protein
MNQFANIPSPFDSLPKRQAGLLEIKKGATLFRQGDESRAMYFIHCGAVSLIRHTEAGQKVTLFRAKAGDTIAEPSIFSEDYHCDAVAEQQSTVSTFDKETVLARMTEDSAFAAALVKRLAGQVQTYRRRLELLAIRSATEWVLAGLADGRLTGTVLEFAAELGLSNEVVYRALAKLVR